MKDVLKFKGLCMLTNELNNFNNIYYMNSHALNNLLSYNTELIKLFKNKSINKFKQQDITKYIQYLQKKNTNATINTKLAYLSKCLKYYNNPLIIPYQKVINKQKNIITEEQYLTLLNNVTNAELRQFIQIAFYTGFRSSEILHIYKQHIKKEVINNKNIYFINIYNTKNHKDNYVPISPKLNNCLENYIEFTLNYKQLYYELKKLNLTAHQFRHSFITRCFEHGLDSFTVMKLVNQTSLQSTKRYIHLSNKYLADVITKL